MATLKDIAKASGLSITAVSYALKGSTRVSKETIERVNREAEKLNYRPSGPAKSLKSNKTWNIGVFFLGFSSPIYGALLQSMCDFATSKGYEIFAASTLLSDRLLVEKNCDGAIMLNAIVDNEAIARLQNPDFPMVLLDRELSLPHVSSVVTDNEMGGYMAAKEILSCHKNVAVVSGGGISFENDKRLVGIKRAFIEHGINPDKIPKAYGHYTEASGREAAIKLLQDYPDIDGLICCNDEMAIGALGVIREMGLIPGKDIGVVGFDDIPIAAYCSPSLSTVKVDLMHWGYMAVLTLIDMIENKAAAKTVKIPVSMVRRQSVGRIEIGL